MVSLDGTFRFFIGAVPCPLDYLILKFHKYGRKYGHKYRLLARAFEKWNSRLRERTKQERDEEKDAPAWIKWYLTEAGMTPASIRKAVRMFTGTQAVSAFSPAQAAAIYEKLLPAGF